MNLYQLIFWGAAAAVTYAAYREEKRKPRLPSQEMRDHVLITKTPLANGGEILRLRGSFDDVMSALDPTRKNEKPPLPADLDIDSLKYYEGGCPHCRTMSMVGENTWRYQALSCTRERWDNTTTYLARCKKCQGFMKSTVDHND